ncbi:MAG TPA: amidohydrolase [Nocardioidaceae bacterium]|nr:amidohydrolase [Nocardioidaceae bacterium]
MSNGAADLVLRGGRVWTGAPDAPWADAIALRGGRIAMVGSEDAVRAEAGGRAEMVDLRGRLVLPAFHDAHIHPVQGALERMRCDLSELAGAQAYVEAVRRYADAHPDREWITGGGWSMEFFPGGAPSRDLLDDVVPDRPVFLPNRDHHSAWVNSAALRRAGVDASSADPADGRIERDPAGRPAGTLHEGAMDLVARLLPPATGADLDDALVEAQRYLFSLGIVGWQDAIVGEYAGLTDSLGTYCAAAESGRLQAKVVGALWWRRDRGEEQVEELVDRRTRALRAGFRATSVKIMQDGVPENFTAAMLDPYLDPCGHADHGRGLSYVDPTDLARYVTRLDGEGFQVHVHAIGDRAVRESLDAFQAAREAGGGSDRRHHIAHVQVVHPRDVPRFAELGVVANCQPLWAVHDRQMDELCLPHLGPERAGWQYPFAALRRQGACLAGGSDWPVSSPDPLWGAHVAANRTLPADAASASYDHAGQPFLPEQRIPLAEAIAAYTHGSAYVNHAEGDTGTLEVGKAADLVVVDRDVFDAPVGEVADARVDLTVVDGRVAYERTSG